MRNLGLFLLGLWLIAQGFVDVFKISFSYDRIILASAVFSSGIILLLSVLKTIPREFGIFLLSVWLIMSGSLTLFDLEFPYSSISLSIIGSITGLMLIFRK